MERTDESLREFLNKIAIEQNYENPVISVKEISSGGANYTSKLFTAVIREKNKEELHLFVKVAALSEKFRNGMDVLVYENENFAYTKLGKMYASLEEECGVPEEHRLHLTKFYGFDSTLYQETIVLENLLAAGYGDFDRFHSITWDYASATVTELAKLHALSFAFSEKFPEEFEKTLKRLTIDWSGAQSMLQNAVDTALKAVKPEHKKALEKFFVNMSISSIYKAFSKTVIIHGDFRGSNLLHKVRQVSS